MGASPFYVTSRGATAQEAFDKAVKAAQYEHGHGGYTGTIAEKASDGFTMAASTPLDRDTARKVAAALIDNDSSDNVIASKYGPAGCIELTGGAPGTDTPLRTFYFFGWAAE